IGRHAEGNAGGLDLALGAYEPLRHRRFGDEERAGDLGGRESTNGPEDKGDLLIDGQRWMAASEDQLEPVASNLRVIESAGCVHRLPRSLCCFDEACLLGERAVAPDAIEGTVASSSDEPRPRVGGHAVSRPAVGRNRERVLRRFLGEVEVAEEADRCGEDIPPLLPVDAFEALYHCMIGRTSMAPPRRAAGMRAASSMAASRSSAS